MPLRAKYGPIEDVLDLIPREFADPAVRRRLRKLTQLLDELAAEDENKAAIVDEDTVLRIVRDRDIFPPEIQDRVQRELKAHLGTKLKKRGTGRHLTWRELEGRDTPIKPVPLDTLRKMGIDASATGDQVRAALRKNFPDIPDFWLDADAPRIRETALEALQHNRSVWDCCVAHLGYWAAVVIFAAVGAFLIVGTATGPWGIPLAVWLISVLGFGTAVIVLNCVKNPNWQ